MSESLKRSAGSDEQDHPSKRQKSGSNKKWRYGAKGKASTKATVEPGDAGIFASCTRGKERKAEDELHDLLSEYISELYSDLSDSPTDGKQDDSDRDIEADITSEVEHLKASNSPGLLKPIKVDLECVVFFKIRSPIDVTSLVHRICRDAQQNARPQRCRFIQRLTPVTLIAKATEDGLEQVAKSVLSPSFHQEGQTPRKFAIRTTIRHGGLWKRDDVIKRVARLVGNLHSVDLKNYDQLVLVDIWKSFCGMSVVGRDYDELKRYNLAELYAPTPRAPASETNEAVTA